jgi:MoaA/NifB/PqqE/SkfB family radical SAM enzyme
LGEDLMVGKVDLKLGYSCNNNCVHCVIADQSENCINLGRSPDRTTEECISELNDNRSRGYNNLVLTGGEPTIRKDIFQILDYSKRIGYYISMQTNGRMFYYKEFARKFIPYNIFYAIAVHGPNKDVHEPITRSKDSFDQTIAGIKNLKKLGVKNICGKTVISKINYRYLPDIARLFLKLGIERINFAFPHANGNAWKYFDEVVPDYRDIMDYVYKTIETVKADIDFEAIPFCLMKGYENYVSEIKFVNEIPSELKQLDSGKQDWITLRKSIKSKFPQCRKCKYDNLCEGVWKEYPEKRGYKEFMP